MIKAWVQFWRIILKSLNLVEEAIDTGSDGIRSLRKQFDTSLKEAEEEVKD